MQRLVTIVSECVIKCSDLLTYRQTMSATDRRKETATLQKTNGRFGRIKTTEGRQAV